MSLSRLHPEDPVEFLHVPQSVSYNWSYDADREKLMRLYEHAKRDQWNGTSDLDWSHDVDPRAELLPDMG